MSVTKSTTTTTTSDFHGKTTGAQYEAPVVLVDQLGKDDVLLGRGTGPNEHQGNICYRALVKETIQGVPPAAVDRRFKMMLARQVVRKIQERGGRFVKSIGGKTTNSSKQGSSSIAPKRQLFALVADKVAIEKTVQSFRFQLQGFSNSLSEASASQAGKIACTGTSKDRIQKSAPCRPAHEVVAARDDSRVTTSFHKAPLGLLELQKRQADTLDIQPKCSVPKTPQEALDYSARSVAASKWKPSHSRMDPATTTSAEPLANMLLQGGTPCGGASQDLSALLLMREHLSAITAAEEALRRPLGLLSRPLPTAPLPSAALIWLARGDQQSPSLEHVGALELLSKFVTGIPPPQVDPTVLPGLLAATSRAPYYQERPYTNSSSLLSAHSGASSLGGVDSTSLLGMILLEQALFE
jgi:hypothetical protein